MLFELNGIKFPRPMVSIEGCIAAISNRNGEPLIRSYPKIKYKNDYWFGNRLSIHLNKKKIPRTVKDRRKGLGLHTCDKKWCINPDHLYVGNGKQNSKDTFERNIGIRERIGAKSKGRKFSNASRLKMRISQLGNKNSLGYKHSIEARKRMSFSKTGTTFTKEHRENISKSLLKFNREMQNA